jgi:DNA mismatch repair ATPase MutL
MPFSMVIKTNPITNFTLVGDKQWQSTLGENIVSVLGKQRFSQLAPFSSECPKVRICGYITKTVLSGSVSSNKVSKDSVFCFLNRRPIDLPRKMKQLFQDTYKQYNPASIPYLVLNLEVEDGNYDINVSVDKREVFLNNENEVLESLKLQLTQFFEDL